MMKPCRDCGRLVMVNIGDDRRCPACARKNRRHRKEQGLTGQRGSTTQWRKLREQVFARDGRVCVNCKATTDLQVDHRDGNAANNTLRNLRVLCGPCNRAAHQLRVQQQNRRTADGSSG